MAVLLACAAVSAQAPRAQRSLPDPFRPLEQRRSSARRVPGSIKSVRRPAPSAPRIPLGPRQISDVLDLAVQTSRRAHRVQTTGAVRHDLAAVGTLSLPVDGIRLDAGKLLRATLNTPGAKQNTSLLITLSTGPTDVGRRQSFTVRVDGRELLSISDRDPGAGVARSFFLDFAADGPQATVEVEADKSTEAPVTVAILRCYSGLSPAAIANALRKGPPKEKMGIALVSPKGMGYSIDVETIKTLFRSLPATPYLEEQVAVLYNFCARGAAENQAEIDQLAQIAQQTNVPLRVAFQMHWGGSPRGVPDGAGGTFTDLPYQQVTFDPDDSVEDPGLSALMGDRYDVRYGLSVPNVWSNTPWLTYNHPRLNQLRKIRLTQALRFWQDARERLAARGKARLFPGQLSSGDETIYWASGVDDRQYAELNGGKPRAHLAADFNPFTVSDAQRDGVNLDPRDGLDAQERAWLHQNLARQQQRVIDWMFDALPADPVRLATNPPFETDLVRRNLYTEPYAMPVFPMKETGTDHPGIELGYVRNGKSGAQYWSGEMLPWLLKTRERGRIALPNLECTGAPAPQLLAALRSAYSCGARFATLYNWDKGPETLKVLRQFAGGIQRPAAEEYLPAPSGPKVGVGKRWERELSAGSDAFGINRIDLFGLDASTTPVRVTLRGPDGGEMIVHGKLQPSAGAPTASPIFLPTLFPQRPDRKYTLIVELDSTAQPTAPNIALAPDGKIAVRLIGDISLERARSRAIADWQDAADILDSMRAVHKNTMQPRFALEALIQAQILFRDARPREAYTAAVRAEQLALPSSYAVPAPGRRLTPYWINVDCPAGPVTATILGYSNSRATVSLRSAVAQTVTVRRGNSRIQASLTPSVAAEVALDLRAGR